MVRLKRSDKPSKDIVYLLIIKEKVLRICSFPEDFTFFNFLFFIKILFRFYTLII